MLASRTLSENDTLICWAAFKISAEVTSGRLEFTHFRVSDRTTFKF